MKLNNSILILALAATIFAACEDASHNKNIPEINITSPQNEATFLLGDTVFIKAIITAPADIHGYEVAIATGMDTVFYMNDHAHGTSLQVDTFWVDTFTYHAHCKIYISAVGDHNGTTSTDTVSIHCTG